MQPQRGAMARILIIDDDDYTRAALRRALERASHTVIEACNGREGLRLYRFVHLSASLLKPLLARHTLTTC
jgi:DNA-binding NtrC family response regulator